MDQIRRKSKIRIIKLNVDECPSPVSSTTVCIAVHSQWQLLQNHLVMIVIVVYIQL